MPLQKNQDHSVDIVMACYQGAKYIEEQIASIMAQQEVPFHLWIRDDCSTDKTLELIAKWKQKYPNSITVLANSHNLGIKENFTQLMGCSQAPYLMLADQDDFWLPGKIAASIERLKQLEKAWGSAMPILIHSDLKVVDTQLKVIAPSFWQYSNLNPRKNSLNRLLVQNVVTGCTVAINRALLQLSLPIPQEALMHDWWLALTASAFGVIDFLPDQTILYRQHMNNDTGAKRYGLLAGAKGLFTSKKNLPSRQARAFAERFCGLLGKQLHKKLLIEALSDLEQQSFIPRIKTLWQHRLFKYGALRNIKLFLDL